MRSFLFFVFEIVNRRPRDVAKGLTRTPRSTGKNVSRLLSCSPNRSIISRDERNEASLNGWELRIRNFTPGARLRL